MCQVEALRFELFVFFFAFPEVHVVFIKIEIQLLYLLLAESRGATRGTGCLANAVPLSDLLTSTRFLAK